MLVTLTTHIRFVIATLFLGSIAAALGSGGATPVWQVPVTLDQPGTYYLSRSLSGAGAGPLVTIAADDVTFDLRGHRLERTDVADAVIGSSGNPSGVVVRNGSVVGGLYGLNIENFAGSAFDVRIEGLTVRGSSSSGIRVAGGAEVVVPTDVVIADNIVAAAGGHGIHVFALDAGRISNNVIRAAGQDGILVELCEGVFVRENNATFNGLHGIVIQDTASTVLENNLVARNSQFGLLFQNSVDDNCYIGNRMLKNGSGDISRIGESQFVTLPCPDNVP